MQAKAKDLNAAVRKWRAAHDDPTVPEAWWKDRQAHLANCLRWLADECKHATMGVSILPGGSIELSLKMDANTVIRIYSGCTEDAEVALERTGKPVEEYDWCKGDGPPEELLEAMRD